MLHSPTLACCHVLSDLLLADLLDSYPLQLCLWAFDAAWPAAVLSSLEWCPQVQVSRERELTISGNRQRATADAGASKSDDQDGVVDVGSSDSETDSKVRPCPPYCCCSRFDWCANSTLLAFPCWL